MPFSFRYIWNPAEHLLCTSILNISEMLLTQFTWSLCKCRRDRFLPVTCTLYFQQVCRYQFSKNLTKTVVKKKCVLSDFTFVTLDHLLWLKIDCMTNHNADTTLKSHRLLLLETSGRLANFMADITLQKPFPGHQHSLQLLTKNLWLLMVFVTMKMNLSGYSTENWCSRKKNNNKSYSALQTIIIQRGISNNSKKQSPSQEADCCPNGKEIPTLLWNPKVDYCVHKSLPLAHIMNQLNPF
jgi:hypothetical protein